MRMELLKDRLQKSSIADKSFIRVYMRSAGVRVLGPGNRYVLWVQGCYNRCVGCVAANGQDVSKGELIPIDELVKEIIDSGCDGFTISGGEPMLQAENLTTLIDRVKEVRDIGVIVYTGYIYEDLLLYDDSKKLIGQADLLIDGPFDINRNDGKPHRGSSNQRLLFLTDRYTEDPYYNYTEKRVLQTIPLPQNEVIIAGIPYAIPLIKNSF